ncbi:hypothetical protein [Bacteroides sp.]|uniref:hypothetical protein n=1 Tax=Bacteroides sp. TaxID=29523 RepID=UPI00260F42F4|nr:hypothetical protein [Bacteroides sp.]
MKFSYYDTLANLILGYLLLFILMYIIGVEYNEKLTIPYMAAGFVLGYFLNAISGLLEGFYYWTFGGMPSTKLLQHDETKGYAGIDRVRFYETKRAVQLLKEECKNQNADERHIFGVAMRFAGALKDTRIPTFNEQYVFSRVMLTFVIISTVLIIVKFPCCWITYATTIPTLLLAWNRCRERGYYFAKEVLKEYLNCKK